MPNFANFNINNINFNSQFDINYENPSNQNYNKKYVFKTRESNDLTYRPKKETFKYYQLCAFKNPHSGKYQIRRLLINESCEIVKVDESVITHKEHKKFIKSHRDNQFKVYSTYDISLIDIPNPGEILMSQSCMLNNDSEYTGFASY